MSHVQEWAPIVWPPRSGHGIESDRSFAPSFCPLCGRRLWANSWDTVSGDRTYDELICFGDKWRWSIWLRRRFKLSTTPSGVHYLYSLGHRPSVKAVKRFDEHTGLPLAQDVND